MAFAEQQHWITVQQKTFTKWLNTKIEVRNLEVKDLVKDLSDGVRSHSWCSNCMSVLDRHFWAGTTHDLAVANSFPINR
jgi:hypothetical protein